MDRNNFSRVSCEQYSSKYLLILIIVMVLQGKDSYIRSSWSFESILVTFVTKIVQIKKNKKFTLRHSHSLRQVNFIFCNIYYISFVCGFGSESDVQKFDWCILQEYDLFDKACSHLFNSCCTFLVNYPLHYLCKTSSYQNWNVFLKSIFLRCCIGYIYDNQAILGRYKQNKNIQQKHENLFSDQLDS